MKVKLANILLVEDNEGDIELTREAFEESGFHSTLQVVEDGGDALDFLYKRGRFAQTKRPDIILMDLNIPGTDGREVLQVVKKDDVLRTIPIIILTSSQADKDVSDAYSLLANCYIVKPVDAVGFMNVIQSIENFWVQTACLPSAAF